MPASKIEIEADFEPIFKTQKETPSFDRTVKSSQNMTLNDKNIAGITAYNVDGYNYVKLRDFAMMVKDTKSKFNLEVGSGFNFGSRIEPCSVFFGIIR